MYFPFNTVEILYRYDNTKSCASFHNHVRKSDIIFFKMVVLFFKVNQELKKLLVASVGEDLQHRVERLTR